MTKMILAMAGTVALAAPANANTTTVMADMEILAPATVAPPVTPDELRTQAEALFSQPKQWKRAARLLEQSAHLRAADDPDGYVCLLMAGRLRHAIGDHGAARQNLEQAAEQALSRGAVVDAANALIDAAHIAVVQKDVDAAAAFVERARLLSGSPLLTDVQRNALSRRIG